MSIEVAIQENTAAMRELIAVWSKLNAQAKAIDKSESVDTVTAAGKPVEAKTEKAAKETTKPKAETKPAEAETKAAPAETKPAETETAGATYQDAAAAITKLSRTKGRDAAVAILTEFGAAKLPDVKPEQFADVIAAAEAALQE